MAKEKIKLVKAGKLDAEGWKKLGKSFLISLGGAVVVFLGDVTNTIDFGGMGAVAAAFMPLIVNFLRKWLMAYEAKA